MPKAAVFAEFADHSESWWDKIGLSHWGANGGGLYAESQLKSRQQKFSECPPKLLKRRCNWHAGYRWLMIWRGAVLSFSNFSKFAFDLDCSVTVSSCCLLSWSSTAPTIPVRRPFHRINGQSRDSRKSHQNLASSQFSLSGKFLIGSTVDISNAIMESWQLCIWNIVCQWWPATLVVEKWFQNKVMKRST